MPNNEGPQFYLPSKLGQVVKVKEATQHRERFSSYLELQSLETFELTNINSFTMKEDMVQGVEETSAEDIHMDTNTAISVVKNSQFGFIEMSVAAMTQRQLNR